jgi:hypothetical protein
MSLSALLWLVACENPKPSGSDLPFKDDSTSTVLPEDGTQPTLQDTAAIKENGPSFRDHCKTLASTVFTEEYKEVGLDQLEDSPKFKQAREMVFLKYIRRNPINNKFAGQIIPRFVWKGYQFVTADAATASLEEWLNNAEHSGDSIVLGKPVSSLKLPPMVCAVVGQEVYMLPTPCLYKGEEQDQLVQRFMAEMKKAGAQHRFRVGCNAGQVTYE